MMFTEERLLLLEELKMQDQTRIFDLLGYSIE